MTFSVGGGLQNDKLLFLCFEKLLLIDQTRFIKIKHTNVSDGSNKNIYFVFDFVTFSFQSVCAVYIHQVIEQSIKQATS